MARRATTHVQTHPIAGRAVALLLLLSSLPIVPLLSAAAGDLDEAASTPPTVIAYIDSGINPYHETFRAPDWTRHPSEFVPGYPVDAQAFPITLDAPDFETAWEADAGLWASIEYGQLYYVPGTRIIGAMLSGAGPDDWFDRSGHGTLAASSGSGTLGTAPESAIVALLQAGNGEVWTWLRDNQWVDVVSTSFGWGGPAGPPPQPEVPWPGGGTFGVYSEAIGTFEFTQTGRLHVGSAGNGIVVAPTTNMFDPVKGPPWSFVVGGFDGNGTETHPYWICPNCDRPFDVAARYTATVAETRSLDEVRTAYGTSVAAPSMAGYAARLIDAGRVRLGDDGAPDKGVYARTTGAVAPPPSGPLADGALERDDIEEALHRAAQPVAMRSCMRGEPAPHCGPIVPATAQSRYTYQGYGVFSGDEYARAEAWLLGAAELGERHVEDEWHERYETLRATYWAPWICQWQQGYLGTAECGSRSLANS